MNRCTKHSKSTRHVAFLALEKKPDLMVVNIVLQHVGDYRKVCNDNAAQPYCCGTLLDPGSKVFIPRGHQEPREKKQLPPKLLVACLLKFNSYSNFFILKSPSTFVSFNFYIFFIQKRYIMGYILGFICNSFYSFRFLL